MDYLFKANSSPVSARVLPGAVVTTSTMTQHAPITLASIKNDYWLILKATTSPSINSIRQAKVDELNISTYFNLLELFVYLYTTSAILGLDTVLTLYGRPSKAKLIENIFYHQHRYTLINFVMRKNWRIHKNKNML